MTDPLTDSLLLLFSEKVRERKDPVSAVTEVNEQLRHHRKSVDVGSAQQAGLRNIGALHLTHVIKRAYESHISAEMMVRVLSKAGHPLNATAFAIQRSYGPMTALTLIDLLQNDDVFSLASESDLYSALTETGFDQEQIVNALWIKRRHLRFSEESTNAA